MRKKKFFSFIGNIIFYLVLVFMLFISFTVIKAKVKGVQPELFGYKFYGILTGSMYPTIEPGDLIIVKDIGVENIKVDDIITFGSESLDNITTHRVKEVINEDELKFVTQGDANNVQDPNPVDSSIVKGKVVKFIPNVGQIMQYIQRNIVMIMTLLAMFIIGAFGLVTYLKSDKEKKVDNN